MGTKFEVDNAGKETVTGPLIVGAPIVGASPLQVFGPLGGATISVSDNATATLEVSTTLSPLGNRITSNQALTLSGETTDVLSLTAGQADLTGNLDVAGDLNVTGNSDTTGVASATTAVIGGTTNNPATVEIFTVADSAAIMVSDNSAAQFSVTTTSSPAGTALRSDGTLTLGGTSGDVASLGSGVLSVFGDVDISGQYKISGTPGVTAGPFTMITSITVVGGIVTDLQGS